MDAYRRRVSAEEAREGYLLVEKRALAFFPPVGERFTLDEAAAAVDAYDCTCRGPDRPHRHTFLRVSDLVAGEEVAVERTGTGSYALRRATR